MQLVVHVGSIIGSLENLQEGIGDTKKTLKRCLDQLREIAEISEFMDGDWNPKEKRFYTGEQVLQHYVEGYVKQASSVSHIHCAHANEMPAECPCPDECVCKKETCSPRKRVLFRGRQVIEGWPERLAESQKDEYLRLKNGTQVRRLHRGEIKEPNDPDQPCHDCSAIKGELHVAGCDCERCPLCGGQLIICHCPYIESEESA